MSRALSIDPLTYRLQSLSRIPVVVKQVGSGFGTPSQQGHVATWNAPDGIRAQASAAGLLDWDESNALAHALNYWPWLPESDRRDVNRVVTMLFYIRCNDGFEHFDRSILSTIKQFELRTRKPVKPRELWHQSRTRRQRDRERGTFVTI